MIIRNFEGKKYRRTYIGGTKEKEFEIFLNVQGTKEDNSECDWLEYRRIFTEYFNDKLHVLLSWKTLMLELSYFFLILSILSHKNMFLFFILIGIGIILQIMGRILSFIINRHSINYDIGLSITLSEIQKQTGFQLSKN